MRSIGGLLGLRVFTVTVRVRTWDGSQPGNGAYTDVDTSLVNTMTTGQTFPVRVQQVSRRDVIASGGVYTDRDLRFGPMTPPYPAGIFPAGGFDDSTLDVAPSAEEQAREVFWRITGPSQGIPPQGAWFEKVGEEYTALHAYVILRANGRVP